MRKPDQFTKSNPIHSQDMLYYYWESVILAGMIGDLLGSLQIKMVLSLKAIVSGYLTGIS